jgi:lipopolysaccharide assembly protein A
MAFLKTLFWIVLTIVMVVFFMHNWTPTEINLFGDLVWQTKLPVALLLAFLLGFIPLYLWHRVTRWNDRRRIAASATAASAPVPASPTESVVVQAPPAHGKPLEDPRQDI